MTIGERGQHQNMSREQEFMTSNERNVKVDGSAQKRLLISEVEWDLENKQWRVVGQQHDYDLQSSEPQKSKVRRRRRKKAEDRTNIDEQRLIEMGYNQRRKSSVAEHLLILADSAELLSGSMDNCREARNNQYKDRKRKKKPLDTFGGIHNVEAEKTAFPMKEKIRLTHLRRLARAKNHQLVQVTQENQACFHMGPKSFEDSQHVEKVAADHSQEAMSHQNVEGKTNAKVNEQQRDHQYHTICAAQGGSKIIDFRQPCIAAPLQNGRQQLILPHHIINHQPVQMTCGPLLWNDKLKDPSMKDLTDSQQPPNASEIEKDPKLIARERRKLRTHRLKKYLKEQQVQVAQQSFVSADAQMYEAGQQSQWHMWNFQNWKTWEIEQQRLLQNRGKPLNGTSLGEDKHVSEGLQNPHVVTRVDQCELQLGANKNSKRSTIIEFQRDQSAEHQNHEPVKAYTEPEKAISSVKGLTRVSHLKRVARMRNGDTMERKQEVQL